MLLVRRSLMLLVGVFVIITILAYNTLIDNVKENEIVVYTSLLKEEAEVGVKVFEAEHPGITVKLHHVSTGVLAKTLLAEGENPQADLIWGLAATNLFPLEWKGALKGYEPRGLKRLNPRFYDSLKPPKWVGFDAWLSVLCVNKKELEKRQLPLPQSLADLSNPTYKGLIVAPNPNTSGTGYLVVSSILQNYESEALGWQYLDELHQNVVYYTPSDVPPCDLAKAGIYPIGISSDISSGAVQGIKESESDSFQIVFPSEGSGWEIEASALINKDNIKPAAKTFLDWAITDSAISVYANYSAVFAVDSQHPISEIYPDPLTEQLIDNNFARYAANRDNVLKQWNEQYGGKVATDSD